MIDCLAPCQAFIGHLLDKKVLLRPFPIHSLRGFQKCHVIFRHLKWWMKLYIAMQCFISLFHMLAYHLKNYIYMTNKSWWTIWRWNTNTLNGSFTRVGIINGLPCYHISWGDVSFNWNGNSMKLPLGLTLVLTNNMRLSAYLVHL